ncbi:hypothetical protein HCA69_12285 [Listeria grandensis]|uniref:Uncharacterized protein n=1 Tax=Listeria grandensis TaxID=1494963 RepID=A0A7X1CQK8_9LIST|nr:hypothetical protein [Listeria grandensis]MBC1937150.1 hypothetical protein [Listeria grandensis]
MTEKQIIVSELNQVLNRAGKQLSNKIVKSGADLDSTILKIEKLAETLKGYSEDIDKAVKREALKK